MIVPFFKDILYATITTTQQICVCTKGRVADVSIITMVTDGEALQGSCTHISHSGSMTDAILA